jgi:hypothetical protein
MKKILLIVAFVATAFAQNTFAQDTNQSPLLTLYYSIKDALVNGNSNAAAELKAAIMLMVFALNTVLLLHVRWV